MTELLWQPKHPEQSTMHQFLQWITKKHQITLENYQQLHTWSVEQAPSFWQDLAEFFQIPFKTPPKTICNDYDEMIDARWFTGATCNFAEVLLSRRDDHPALISYLETGERTLVTYAQLYQSVAACAAGLKAQGVQAGDRVAAFMPNIPETIIAMLATASLGAIWSSCSPDFGMEATLDRLGQIQPNTLFICDGHFYAGKKHPAIEKLLAFTSGMPSVKNIIVCPVIHDTDPRLAAFQTWNEFLIPSDELEFTALPFDHPLYILFSSGTTGKPKCIIHGAGGTLLQHMKELGLHTDIQPQDNLLFYTTCGWMMWNWMVSTLSLGATLTLYEGSPLYPDAGRLFEIIHQEKVTVFGISAKFLSTVEKSGIKPETLLKDSKLRCILSTGSPLLAAGYDFVYQHIKNDVQLSSISGGTDIISCFALGNPLLPVYKGELQCIGLGMQVEVFNEHGLSVREQRGELVCTKAFPSMPIGFWNDSDRSRYKKAYFSRFPGIWAHGDFAEITAHNGLIIYGRSDAVLNPGGVRIGTAEIYRQVEHFPEIVDSVVIAQDWQDDVRIVLFVKLQPDTILTPDLQTRIKNHIKQHASPRHVPAVIVQVADIPRTLSGKTVELAVRQVVHGQSVNNLEALANPEALDCFRNRVELL